MSSSNEARKSLGNSSKDVVCVCCVGLSLGVLVMSSSKAAKKSCISGLLVIGVELCDGCWVVVLWRDVSTVRSWRSSASGGSGLSIPSSMGDITGAAINAGVSC